MEKILISDYDLTFYINDKDIKSNIEAVKEFRSQGNLFVIATGRSYDDLMRHVKRFNIAYDYAILNHGATIIDSDDNILFNNAIQDADLKDILKVLDLDNSKKYFCCHELESVESADIKDITKINVLFNSFLKTLKINELINSKFENFTSYINKRKTLEIVSSSSTKAKAIQKLIKIKKLDDYQVYTIGDGYSDIDMIKDYNGFAIKNSITEIKKIAVKEYGSVRDLVKDII